MTLVPRHSPGLRVVTANVNGVRAAARRGGLEWMAALDADVVCLQEVRATDAQLDEALAGSPLSHLSIAHSPAPQLGRSGVAVLTRDPATAVRAGSGPLGGMGRWLEVDVGTDVGPVTVVSTYVHTGEAMTPRQDEKYAFLAAMDRRLAALRRASAKSGTEVVVCGDFNVAHREVDIKNWKGNRGRAGFLVDERAYLDRWFHKHWSDLGRIHGGSGPGPYTWWSWRGKGFDTDGGWRIDYVMATPGLAARCTGVHVGKAATYQDRWSDHAPVVADFR